MEDREIIEDRRLLQLNTRCPECGQPMTARGRMFRMAGTTRWHVAFESECRPDEEFGLWEPGFDGVIEAILRDQAAKKEARDS